MQSRLNSGLLVICTIMLVLSTLLIFVSAMKNGDYLAGPVEYDFVAFQGPEIKEGLNNMGKRGWRVATMRRVNFHSDVWGQEFVFVRPAR